MKRLKAAVWSLLAATACNGPRVAVPTAPTPADFTNPTASAGGPTAIPFDTIGPDSRWTCVDGDGDFCVDDKVTEKDPTCFRNWDATGHCRQLNLTVSADGTLVAVMQWTGPSRGLYDPDLFLLAPDGVWTYASDAWPEKHTEMIVERGKTYRIVVLSYGTASQPFTLNLAVRED
jgi:hypothetical protein